MQGDTEAKPLFSFILHFNWMRICTNMLQENGVTYIEISTHQKRNRIRLKCLDQNTYRKNIRITFDQMFLYFGSHGRNKTKASLDRRKRNRCR